MKRRIFIIAPEDLIVFKDSKSESTIYGMSKEVLIEKSKIAEKFGGVEANVPVEHVVKVHPFKFIGKKDNFTDTYSPDLETLVEFPINRIEWILIQLIDSKF